MWFVWGHFGESPTPERIQNSEESVLLICKLHFWGCCPRWPGQASHATEFPRQRWGGHCLRIDCQVRQPTTELPLYSLGVAGYRSLGQLRWSQFCSHHHEKRTLSPFVHHWMANDREMEGLSLRNFKDIASSFYFKFLKHLSRLGKLCLQGGFLTTFLTPPPPICHCRRGGGSFVISCFFSCSALRRETPCFKVHHMNSKPAAREHFSWEGPALGGYNSDVSNTIFAKLGGGGAGSQLKTHCKFGVSNSHGGCSIAPRSPESHKP